MSNQGAWRPIVALMVVPDAGGLVHVRTSWPGRMTLCLEVQLAANESSAWRGRLESKTAPTCLHCVVALHRVPRA